MPNVKGLIVGMVDGDQQTVLGQLPDLGQQLPCVVNGVFLEVVSEAEISKHFEKRMMAGGITDLIKVIVLATCTHATLGTDGTGIASLLGAKEHVFELHHAGIGKQ